MTIVAQVQPPAGLVQVYDPAPAVNDETEDGPTFRLTSM
jgi:hypothetical protein